MKILSQVDDPHAAAAELFAHSEVFYGLADHLQSPEELVATDNERRKTVASGESLFLLSDFDVHP